MATNSIQYIVELIDKYSPVLNKINEDMKKFKKQQEEASFSIKKLSDNLEKSGKSMIGLGKKFSLRLTTPILALGGNALRLWNEEAQAIEQVRIALESTKGVSGKTLDGLIASAKKLQRETLFGDDTIIGGVTAQLLAFTNIANNQFDRTQQAILNISTRLSAAGDKTMDLVSVTKILGKALNDPVNAIGNLSRSGIQFSKSQKIFIKSLAESGRIAEAQNIILTELEKKYGGAAKAAALAGTGPIKQLWTLIGDSQEGFGKLIMEGISPFIEKLKELAIKVDNLNPSTKLMIIKILALTAALPPLAIFIGSVVFALGYLLTPIGLVVGAITLLSEGIVFLIANWDKIKAAFGEYKVLIYIHAWFILIKNVIVNIIDLFGYFIDKLSSSPIGKLGKIHSSIKENIGEFITAKVNPTVNIGGAVSIDISAAKGLSGIATGRGEYLKLNTGKNMKGR